MSTSVTLPDEIAARLAEEADRRRVPTDELAADLLAEALPERRKVSVPGLVDRPILRSLIGKYSSDGKHRAADSEEYMKTHGFGR